MVGGTAVAERPPKVAEGVPATKEEVVASPTDVSAEAKYLAESLTILVIGASGDLAKKLTAPALYELYQRDYLPKQMTIVGYARSEKTDEELRDAWRPVLVKKHKGEEDRIDAFLSKVIYRRGQYDSAEDVKGVFAEMEEREQADGQEVANRLFYFAVPPSVFADIGSAIKEGALSKTGWNRLVVEKPFGKDTASFEELSKTINGLFTPDQTYFVDHYLGKEMNQNLVVLRFANSMFEPLWNRHYVESVVITFKEDIGTEGRGGYFDSFGIIRDVMQNHLMQMLALIAMDPPVRAAGEGFGDYVRDEKVKVLQAIKPISLDKCVIGQYTAPDDGSMAGYTEDDTVPDDSVTPTYAALVMYVDNPRWAGVPFVMKAGKALDEKKVEVRIKFHTPAAASAMFPGVRVPANELVLRVQPNEAVYLKTNVKTPGLAGAPVASELDLSYGSRFDDKMADSPSAYTRLILDCLRGKQAAFVRDDELRAAWKIFTPLLHDIEAGKKQPTKYKAFSRGPAEADEFVSRFYERDPTYEWHPPCQGDAKM
ncbi:hypothetical protein MMPV_004740 [Pyropia vietnamensis]